MSKIYEFPYKFKDLTDEEKRISISYQDFGELNKVESTKYCCLARMKQYAQELYNFNPRKDDVWLVGYPRCGTTLLQEILYLLGTDLNYEKAASKIMDERFPFLEQILMRTNVDDTLYQKFREQGKPPSGPDEEKLIPYHVKLMNTEEKRFIKSHFGFDFIHPELLEIGCKVVFITRNIKDCLVSLNYYPRNTQTISSDAEGLYKMFQYFRKNLEPFGSYFELLKAAWKRRHSKNLLFLYYEEVVAYKRGAVIKIGDFLGKKLTENQLNGLLNHISVENFRNNKSLNNDHLVDAGVYIKSGKRSFIGEGKVGRWREIFPESMNEEVDEWIRSCLNEIPDFEIPECWKQAMDLN
ncbi:hypothetical protein WA026_001955 [Henosepilachna vigintioctopunctata]|uniref:Sulfotransferase domain-containing protein n=1 Tax=Henosepilachna vigintioctopunctata TaxID=420089 RepID=A0AAW1URE9_9CUCU